MKRLLFILPLFLLLCSCTQNITPKPRGYFRIDVPEHRYQKFDSTFPYSFEYPVYAGIFPDSSKFAEPYWINIGYKPFRATLHISFKKVHGNLAEYLDDAHTLVNKHIPKANTITQREYIDTVNRVFGLVYDIRGTNAASVCQFYVTDSLTSFVRGALYFNIVPNNDSLAPVIDFIRADVEHLINTFRWKNITPR